MKITEPLIRLTEHLLFAAFLLPTLIVIAAAAVSFVQPDPSAVMQPHLVAAQAWHEGNDVP